jgi:hypothetical protein
MIAFFICFPFMDIRNLRRTVTSRLLALCTHWEL